MPTRTAVEVEAKKKKNKRSSSGGRRRRLTPSCFLGCDRGGGKAPPPATEEVEVEVDSSSAADRRPTHLVVTVNGIVGSADNWKYAAKKFVKRYPDDVIVHCSECNCSTLTFDGVDVMGERLSKEVLSVVEHRPELQKISFVAHSLGGLIARYAIALLYQDNVEEPECKKNDIEDSCFNPKPKGRIAGLEPINFITFATPHLGTRAHKQFPLLRGFHILEKMANNISWVLGRTGKHLMLKDTHDGKPPLLFRMVNDCKDLKFMSALQSFKRRVAYSNVHYDILVGWKTSSIRQQHELPKREYFTKDDKYPHVVYVEKPKAPHIQHADFSEIDYRQLKRTREIEDAMIKGLNRVPWERVDVSFRKSKQRIFAHSTIQVKTYSLNSDGADVISHMIDNFLL